MSAFENFPRLTPFLWFDSNAEEAVDFYLSIFKNSRRLDELRNPGDAPGPKGGILTVSFELDGQSFTAMNGGPGYPFTQAVSFVVRCDTQQKSMITGESFPPVARKSSADGSLTSSACIGRSRLRACPNSSKVPRHSRPCSTW